MTNRSYIINLLLDGLENEAAFERESIDDGFASYEAMVYYNIECPYYEGDKRSHCNNHDIGREVCYACKVEWLNNVVDV